MCQIEKLKEVVKVHLGVFGIFYCSYYKARKWSKDKKTEQNKTNRIVVF